MSGAKAAGSDDKLAGGTLFAMFAKQSKKPVDTKSPHTESTRSPAEKPEAKAKKRPMEHVAEESAKKLRMNPSKKLTKAEAKREFLVTDADLRGASSTKSGGRVLYSADDVRKAAERKHGGVKGLEKAKATAKLYGKKIAGKTLEQHRRALGDRVKGQIQVEKWCVSARTHCTIEDCDIDVFRALVVPNAESVTPESFNKDTPVVVASVAQHAANIFGSTKLTGGTRLGSWRADEMELVYFPPTGKMRCWWTMR